MAGAAQSSALFQSVIIGFTNLIFTLVAMTVIDRFGRKMLLLIGTSGLVVCLLLHPLLFTPALGTSGSDQPDRLYCLFCLFARLRDLGFSERNISQSCPGAKGQALGSFTHWIWCAGVSWTYPVIAEHSGCRCSLFLRP